MSQSKKSNEEPLSPITGSHQLSFDKETATRFDKTSVVLSGKSHNFSAEYELGFRDRNDGKAAAANPYSTKLARERWQRGWNARDKYSDEGYKWIEPITDSKAVLWLLAIVFFGIFMLLGSIR